MPLLFLISVWQGREHFSWVQRPVSRVRRTFAKRTKFFEAKSVDTFNANRSRQVPPSTPFKYMSYVKELNMKKFFLLFFLLVYPTVCYADQPAQVNNGRYVIYQHPTFRGDQYILDTKTGKVWAHPSSTTRGNPSH